MDALIIEGPTRLSGSVQISGSKNTALPLLFSTLLFDNEVTLDNVPRLWDIETTLKILNLIGTESRWDKEKGTVVLRPKISKPEAPYEWVRKMRAGILALGPLVAKCGEARVSLPGGCAIGARPVNFHIEAMKKMGVDVEVEKGYIHARTRGKLKGAKVHFPDVTVTGTENILILASVAEGETVLENAAMEPEVISLGEFLKSAGADISGLGTPTLRINGKFLSSPKRMAIPPDRIEAGTWISIAVETKSDLTLSNCRPEEMGSVLGAYSKIGVEFRREKSGLKILPPEKLKPITLDTEVYPGFATDMQAQILTNLCHAEGTSLVRENIFENRFMHVAELRRLGAHIDIDGKTASVHGPVEFVGAPIMATDLRASACLVVAALGAKGTSKISRVYHLDRGYQRLDKKLQELGARVTRIAE